MSTFERGVVKFFDSRPEKRFGFILLPSQEEVFFHFNDGAPVEVNSAGPTLNATLRTREPQKGDALLFQRSKNQKGAKAAPWCFAEDWERVEKEIACRTVYRLVKKTGGFRVKREPIVVWEGHDLVELRQKFGMVKLGFHYKDGSSDWEKHWFECEWPGGWRQLDDCDPRTLKVEQVRAAKPPMPLETVKRNLQAAIRNTIIDRSERTSQSRWVSGGKNVAYGYVGHDEQRVTTEETGQYERTTFEGKEAAELVQLGKPGRVKHEEPYDYADCYDYRFDD